MSLYVSLNVLEFPAASSLVLEWFFAFFLSHHLPAVMDEEITGIIPMKLQFYVGPAESGAPFHFHR